MGENFSFGYWLRRQRMARDLRQDDLARRLGIATVSLRKLEADERRPSLQLIGRVAEVFGLSDTERATLQHVARADLSPAALPLPQRATDPDPRTGDPAWPPTRLHILPAPPNPLIGREAELSAIAKFLAAPALRRDLGDRRGCVAPSINLANALCEQGEFTQVPEHIREALRVAQAIGNIQGIAWAVDAVGRLLLHTEGAEQAARFLGAEESVRATAGLPIWPEDRRLYEQGIARTRAALGEETFAAAFAAGRALSVEAATAEALAWLEATQEQLSSAPTLEVSQAEGSSGRVRGGILNPHPRR